MEIIMDEQISTGKKIYLVLVHLVGGVILAAVMCCIFGAAVMLLWNYFIPEVFGVRQLTVLQGMALVLMGRLIFGSFPGGSLLAGHHKKRDEDDKRKCC
jgi:hypothetical protein